MDSKAIYVEDLPKNLTYADIKDTFCPFQQSPPLHITKKENYLIIGFEKKKTVKRILKHRDSIMLKGKALTIKQAFKQFQCIYVHLPLSLHLPISTLFPPIFIPAPAPAPSAPAPAPAPPPAPAPTPAPAAPYEHPFPEGFSFSIINSSFSVVLISFSNV